LWSRAKQQHVRAEIGRQLREYYEVGSQTIPGHLAQLIENMDRSEQLRDGRHSMSKRAEYVANAKECARLAESAHDPDERTAWLQMRGSGSAGRRITSLIQTWPARPEASAASRRR
jgi:hypothetical protein